MCKLDVLYVLMFVDLCDTFDYMEFTHVHNCCTLNLQFCILVFIWKLGSDI